MATEITGTSESPEPWSLARIIERASEASVEVKALGQDVIAAENRANQAGRWDNPEISIGAGPKTVGTSSSTTFEAGIRQSIPLFGQKSAEKRVGQQNQRIAEVDRDLRTLAIRHKVVRLAYDYSVISEQVKHIAHRREGIGLINQYLTSRPFASPSQMVEKSLIQNRLREIEALFSGATAQKHKAWQELNVFLDLPSPIAPKLEWVDSGRELSRTEIESLAMKQNPELERQTRSIALADLTLEQAGKKVYPDIRAGASYTNEASELREKTYLFTLEFTLPILDRGGYARQAAQAQKDAETYRLEQKLRELKGRISSAWADYEETKRRVELYPVSLVANLEGQFRTAEGSWKKGLVPVVAFLELESQVHEQIVKVFEAQHDFVQSQSELLLLAGKDYEVKNSNGGH
jgi:outer membrane protein TolC